MATTHPQARHHQPVFRGFDQSAERALGADMRLIYGISIPILLVVDVIVLLALSPSYWIVGTLVLFELAALSLVVFGFTEMLDEPDEDETTGDRG